MIGRLLGVSGGTTGLVEPVLVIGVGRNHPNGNSPRYDSFVIFKDLKLLVACTDTYSCDLLTAAFVFHLSMSREAYANVHRHPAPSLSCIAANEKLLLNPGIINSEFQHKRWRHHIDQWEILPLDRQRDLMHEHKFRMYEPNWLFFFFFYLKRRL